MVLRPWMYGLLALHCAAIGQLGYDRDEWELVCLGAVGVILCLWMQLGATAYWEKKERRR